MEKEKRIQILQDIIKIKSVNANEKEVADYLANIFEEYGIETKQVEYAEGRNNLIAEFANGEGKTLGISGHLDVVEAGDEADWIYPPFSGEIDGDKLYGRGTTDMKSGVAALVIAMCELKEEGADLNGTLRFLGTVGEEIGRIGSKQLVSEGYADDIDGLVIAEPSSTVIAYTHKGSMNFTVVSKGKSAHSSMPDEGINAINNMAQFIIRFNEKMEKVVEDYENPDLGRTAASITVINGGDQVNSIPSRVSVEGNIRTIPEFPNEKIKEVMNGIIDELNKEKDFDLELTFDVDDHSVKKASDSELVKIFDELTPDNVTPGGIAPVTDAEAFSKLDHDFDLVIYGPGVSNLPHQLNEYVSIEDYLNKVDLFKKAIKRYLK